MAQLRKVPWTWKSITASIRLGQENPSESCRVDTWIVSNSALRT
jgi:hypothetical protein